MTTPNLFRIKTPSLSDTQAAAAFRHLVELTATGMPVDGNTVLMTADKAAGGIVLMSEGYTDPQSRRRAAALAHFGVPPMA